MPISTANQEQIQREVGDQDAGTLAPFLSGLWDGRADKAGVIAGLQYQYTKRDAVDILMGQVWQQTTVADSSQKVNLEQKLSNLQVIRANTEAEIKKLEARGRASLAPAVGQIIAVTPVTPTGPVYSPPFGYPPDPNEAAYGGDPQRFTDNPVDF